MLNKSLLWSGKMLSTALPPLHGKTPTFKLFHPPISMRFQPKPSPPMATPINHLINTRYLCGPIKNVFSTNGFPVESCGFMTQAKASGAGDGEDEEELKLRGQSSMPDRFRHLTKEAPDKPVRWPWLIGMLTYSLFSSNCARVFGFWWQLVMGFQLHFIVWENMFLL